MGFFTPRFIKEARILSEGASKTLHHHRDLLGEGQIASLQELISSLNRAIRGKKMQEIDQTTRVLETGFAS
ncbi:MAG: hypothetical protein WCR44_09255, partial [Verrucomicrobiota bacterium]